MKSNTFRLYCISLLMLPPIILIAGISISHAATLAWDANTESDLAGYKVYLRTSSRHYTSVITLGKVTSLNLNNLNLSEGIIYYIALTTFDYAHNESDFSDELDFFADDKIPSSEDNCPNVYNPDQEDIIPPGGNGIGDACDDCQRYQRLFACCIELQNADRNVDIITCQDYTNQRVCEAAGCLWNEQQNACMIDLCLADGNGDGKVNLKDIGIFKIEYGRPDCAGILTSVESCQRYNDRYVSCVELQNADRTADYEECSYYPDQGTCEGAGCLWRSESNACMIDMCLMDINFDGDVNLLDLGLLKKEYARFDCATCD